MLGVGVAGIPAIDRPAISRANAASNLRPTPRRLPPRPLDEKADGGARSNVRNGRALAQSRHQGSEAHRLEIGEATTPPRAITASRHPPSGRDRQTEERGQRPLGEPHQIPTKGWNRRPTQSRAMREASTAMRHTHSPSAVTRG